MVEVLSCCDKMPVHLEIASNIPSASTLVIVSLVMGPSTLAIFCDMPTGRVLDAVVLLALISWSVVMRVLCDVAGCGILFFNGNSVVCPARGVSFVDFAYMMGW